MAKIIKVGFDLDGVLLYNPARAYRPIIAWIKKNLLKRDVTKFYYPKNKAEQLIWSFLHKSSVWPADGVNQLINLIKTKKIKAYVISARYESLKSDFQEWIKRIDPDHNFAGYFYNEKNDQPHLYKEEMIKKLNLDIFVEDNWDIVAHLRDKCKVYWIYNFLDKNIDYQYKFPTLRAVLDHLGGGRTDSPEVQSA